MASDRCHSDIHLFCTILIGYLHDRIVKELASRCNRPQLDLVVRTAGAHSRRLLFLAQVEFYVCELLRRSKAGSIDAPKRREHCRKHLLLLFFAVLFLYLRPILLHENCTPL